MMVSVALFLPLSLVADNPLGLSSGDTVSIRADTAWEDRQPDVVHFDGNFLMKAADWSVAADSATLYGKLEDPNSILLHGSPARFLIIRHSEGRDQKISGTAPQIEYRREANVVRLVGGAVLHREDDVLESEEIEYDIDLNRYRAGGDEGVRIKVAPRD